MTGNLKILGLAVVAALALSAVAAAGASAAESHHFEGTKGEALSSSALTQQVFESTTGENSGYKCSEVSVAGGEVENATDTQVTVEPKYGGCKAFKGAEEFAATVRVNECHYLFTGVTTPGNLTEDGEHASVHLQCPENTEIEIRVTAFQFKCAAVPPQEIADAVRYENETTKNEEEKVIGEHVRVIATAHGIESTTVESIAACGNTVHTNGSYTGEVRVSAPSGVSVTKNATPEG